MSAIDDDPTLPDGGHPAGAGRDDLSLFAGEDDPTPRVLGGRYVLEERLGHGGGAVVWRAFDQALSRTVAVKVLRPGLHGDELAGSRLRREAAIAGRIPHPGVVAVYDTGLDDGVAWLALEHVDGPTLLQVLRQHPSGLDPQVAAAVAEQAAVALGHAHGRGLVHRDVKPSNLLLTTDGVVKLADFGVAASMDDGTEPELAGTRSYAAPEQLTGEDGADRPPVDVFALGVVLHECLTGRPAFTGSRRRTRSGGELLAPRQVRPDIPRDLDAVVRRATRADAAARYDDAGAMATALRAMVVTDPLQLTATLVAPDGSPRRSRRSERTSDGRIDREPTGATSGAPASGVSGAPWRWVALALAVLATAGVLTTLAVTDRDTPSDESTSVADVGVPVVAVELFDPYGSVSSDESQPVAAVDDDEDSAWTTPTYPVPLRSLGTPGVGLWLDLGEERTITSVELRLRTGGVTVELLAADSAPTAGTSEADWRSLDRVVRPGRSAFLTASDERARYWLVWFTELQPVGEAWQASLTDIRFEPADTP